MDSLVSHVFVSVADVQGLYLDNTILIDNLSSGLFQIATDTISNANIALGTDTSLNILAFYVDGDLLIENSRIQSFYKSYSKIFWFINGKLTIKNSIVTGAFIS